MTEKEFETEYNKIFEKAMAMSEKSRREGLLALDEFIDEKLLRQRDIMELGFRLTCDGTDLTVIDNILTNIINQETDKEKKLLKNVQKNAVLMIHQGYNKGIFALSLASNVKIGFDNAMKVYLEANKLMKILSDKTDEEDTEDSILSQDEIERFLQEYITKGITPSYDEVNQLLAKDQEYNAEGKFLIAQRYKEGNGLPLDYERALELHHEALEIRRENCNIDNSYSKINIGESCYYIGLCYHEIKEYSKAIQYLLEALEIFNQIYEEKNGLIIDNLCYIAMCYESLNDLEKAIEYYNQTMAADIEVNGTEDNQGISVFLNKISDCYIKSEDYKNALMHSEKALAIREKLNGTECRETAYVYLKIAQNYELQQNYENALSFYNKSFTAYEKANGRDDDETNNSCIGIASCYESMGDIEKALSYYLDAITVNEKVFGKDHSFTAYTYFKAADCYWDTDKQKSLEYYLEALNIRKKICDEDDPDLSLSYNNAGSAYYSLGNYKEALKNHLKALELKKVHCKENDMLAFAYNKTGRDYEALEDRQNAAKFYKEALLIYETLEGSEKEAEETRQAVKRCE